MSNKTSDKNVGSIEEDVKILEDCIQSIHFDECDFTKLKLALEHILAEREQDKARIKELEEELRKYKSLDYMFKIQNEENYVDMKKIYFECLDSIPKQAVIEALNTHKFAYEELNKKYDNTYYEDDEIRTRDFYMIVTEDRIVQVLKKLLEGEVGRRLGE